MWGLNDILTHSIAYGIGEEEEKAKAEREKKASSNWQTGTPTEKGDYLCVFKRLDRDDDIVYGWCTWDGNAWDIYLNAVDYVICTIVAWMPIPPYEEKENG